MLVLPIFKSWNILTILLNGENITWDNEDWNPKISQSGRE
jgi:hypothetical protein